jgi:hypothetical protein
MLNCGRKPWPLQNGLIAREIAMLKQQEDLRSSFHKEVEAHWQFVSESSRAQERQHEIAAL